MRTTILSLLFLFTCAFVSHAQVSAKIDTSASIIVWKGTKVGGEHHGNINFKKGSLIVEKEKIRGGDFTVDMTSISNTDLTSAKWNKKLVDHLNSTDFFDSKNHPEAFFRISKVEPLAGSDAGNYTISGELTIKGITKPISFPAKVNVSDKRIKAKADVAIDRTAYDIKYKSGSFFENLGDKLIHDKFILKIDLTADLMQ